MSSSERRVLVTGATGLIGRCLAEPLLKAGFEVYAITIDRDNPENGYHWIQGSIFDEDFVVNAMSQIRPTHLLNMAWTTTGDYLTNPVNYSFLRAGIHLAQQFSAVQGHRAVYAGSCFEYAFREEPLTEDAPLEPDRNDYTFCKTHLNTIASRLFSRNGVSYCYGRIFNAFGRHEPSSRLTGMVVDRLRRGEVLVVKSGPLVRDFVYARDIANAFVAMLDASVEGVVNVASGCPVTIRDYVLTLAGMMGRSELISFEDDYGSQPRRIVADISRLENAVGYVPQYDLETACREVVDAI